MTVDIKLPTPRELGLSVRFIKRGPGGIKTHKKASVELREKKKVKKSKRAKVTVDIYDSPDLAEWNNATGRLRSYVEQICPPFGMGGERFLANPLIPEFHRRADEEFVEISKWEESFIASLPILKARYESEGGDLSDLPWPTTEELRSKFLVEIDYQELSDVQDIRLGGVNDDQRARFEQEVRNSHDKKVRGVIRHCSEQVADRLNSVIQKMGDYKPRDGDKKAEGVFRNSLIENVKEIAGLLEHWNITKDPEVDAVRRRLLTEIGAVKPGDLRDDAALRYQVKKSAEDILSRVGSFGRDNK